MPDNVSLATLSALAVAQSPVPGQLNGAGDWGGGFFGDAAANYTTNTAGLPLLHSLPSAHTAVYLDFTGWSGNLYGTEQTFAPYDTDGNPPTFSVEEQQDISRGLAAGSGVPRPVSNRRHDGATKLYAIIAGMS